MLNKIRVLIADDVADNRDNITNLLKNNSEIEISGQASTGNEAIQMAVKFRPGIILMSTNISSVDAISSTEKISMEVPEASIIIMGLQGEQERLHRALIAGAKNYLIQPFTDNELVNTVKKVYEQNQRLKSVLQQPASSSPQYGKIISIFSSKGGAGKTTIAVNLAVALAQRQHANIGLLDANLQFGDAALYLDLVPRATIADAIVEADNLDEKNLGTYMTTYSDRLSLMAAPARPEQAEGITSGQLCNVLAQMKKKYEYVVVDTSSEFNEITLAVLDHSDVILVLAGVDLPTIKNMKLCLEIMHSLDFGTDKVHVVLNRANSTGGLSIREIENSLNLKFYATLPSDGKTVLPSINKGIPFVLSNNQTPVAQNIFQLAQKLAPQEPNPETMSKSSKRISFFS
jgi:pilus assembly protein CpaE